MEKTVTKKRPKSAARKGLEAAVAQFEELLKGDALSDKPAKRADIVIEKARALKELLALEAEDRVTETQETIDRLEAQHIEDAHRLAELEAENVTLRTKAVEVKTVTVQDPEHAAVREQNGTLTAALKCVAENLSDAERPQMAICCIQKSSPAAARLFCQLAGVDYSSYVQMFNSYKTESELQSVIDRAQREGPAVIFARAALAVRLATVARSVITIPQEPFVDNRSGEEKLRDAREWSKSRQQSYVFQQRDVAIPEQERKPSVGQSDGLLE